MRERSEQELDGYSSVVSDVEEVENELHIIRIEENKKTTEYEHLELEKKILGKKWEEARTIQSSMEQKKQSKSEHETSLRAVVKQWRALHKELLTVPDGNRLIEERKELLKAIANHQNNFTRSLKHKDALLFLKKESYTIEQKHERIQIDSS